MAASPTTSDVERIIAKQDEIAARQEQLDRQMRELAVEVRALAARTSAELPRPLDRYKDADELMAHLEAVSAKVMRGRVFTDSSTDIVRQFRDDRESFRDE